MEETKIIFDTAKLAKEKGFDLPTECGFEDGISTYCFHYREYGDVVHLDWNNETFRHKKERYSRPTQTFLQKWLREVHNINVWVSSKTTDKGNTIYIPHGRTIPDTKVKGLVKDVIVYKTFDSWEEALEFALQETLKLIKS